jgi:hypothetical protein
MSIWSSNRRIVKDGDKRPDCREPRGMGTIERAMRKYCETKEGHIFEPSVGLTFDSEAEAMEFYNLYSFEVGFGIRKGNWDKNDTGYQTMRELVCQRQVSTYCQQTKPLPSFNIIVFARMNGLD